MHIQLIINSLLPCQSKFADSADMSCVLYKWKFSRDLYFKNFAGTGSIREIEILRKYKKDIVPGSHS